MTVDEVVKLILAIAFAISLVGISIQLMRLIGKVTDTLEDTREGVRNFSALSTMAREDYEEIRREIKSILGFVTKLRVNLLDPISSLFSFVGRFLDKGKADDKSEQAETSKKTDPKGSDS